APAPRPPAPKPAPAAAAPPAPALPPSAAPAPRRARYKICVDAGHGGKDGGTTGRRGTLEKDVNLAAALQLARLLRKDGRFDVMLTRADDTFVKLGDRARMANEAHADLFVSLHSNANPDRAETGYEVYFLSEKASDPEAARLAEFENSVMKLETGPAEQDPATEILFHMARTEFINDAAELAGYVAKELSTHVDLPDRGVKQASFYVLRGAAEPAILVEMGFLSNERDEEKLDSDKYRQRIVAGVYKGIVDYCEKRSPAGTAR
ncbi:MAG: N-acetylmuramoyl-L-alanine amidase, partial [Elusimicrobia bacterium]|nr:N-acetylmuramoyl-L-alanine amidase [Elusimicrobiota bacterium]